MSQLGKAEICFNLEDISDMVGNMSSRLSVIERAIADTIAWINDEMKEDTTISHGGGACISPEEKRSFARCPDYVKGACEASPCLDCDMGFSANE